MAQKKTTSESPWASGPAELLRHGLSLLADDTDSNRRLAMIAIDNSVELMLRTYLELPRRVTGLKISRQGLQEISDSFPRLLDAIEVNASDKLAGIDLGEIEWYHRLRNQLYHQGNGLTVERDKVDVYAGLARVLFANLFGAEVSPRADSRPGSPGTFLEEWLSFEKTLMAIATRVAEKENVAGPKEVTDAAQLLREADLIDDSTLAEIRDLRIARNQVVHGISGSKKWLTRINDEIIGLVARVSGVLY